MLMNPISYQWRILAALLFFLAALLFFLAALAFGFVVGVTHESNRRDALELKQQQSDDKAFKSALARGRQHADNAITWRNRARIYYRNWQERLNHEQDSNLAQCQQAGAVLLSSTFVGMYNAAWLPQFDGGDPAGTAGEVVEAGAVTPRHVLENVRENADLCGEDRKRLDELIDALMDMGAGK